MDSNQITIGLIISCVIVVFAFFFSKPLKTLARIFVRGAIGSGFIFLLNLLLAPMSLAVGINFVTAITVGVLGIPGLVTLYILQVML